MFFVIAESDGRNIINYIPDVHLLLVAWNGTEKGSIRKEISRIHEYHKGPLDMKMHPKSTEFKIRATTSKWFHHTCAITISRDIMKFNEDTMHPLSERI